MLALKTAAEFEKAQDEALGDISIFQKIKLAWGNDVVRRGLYAGVTVQVAQQFVGINTVMYYSPTIVQFAGFASNKTALALSLITSGLNAIGSLVSMMFVDRYGRRRLMMISMIGIISCLIVLSAVFYQASLTAPKISKTDSLHFGSNSTCDIYLSAKDSLSWNCMDCIHTDKECSFCSNAANAVSIFLAFYSF